MIEHFLGTWKLVSSENFEEYMKELGEKYHYNIQKLVMHFVMRLGLYITINFSTLFSLSLFFFFVIPGYIQVRLTKFMSTFTFFITHVYLYLEY